VLRTVVDPSVIEGGLTEQPVVLTKVTSRFVSVWEVCSRAEPVGNLAEWISRCGQFQLSLHGSGSLQEGKSLLVKFAQHLSFDDREIVVCLRLVDRTKISWSCKPPMPQEIVGLQLGTLPQAVGIAESDVVGVAPSDWLRAGLFGSLIEDDRLQRMLWDLTEAADEPGEHCLCRVATGHAHADGVSRHLFDEPQHHRTVSFLSGLVALPETEFALVVDSGRTGGDARETGAFGFTAGLTPPPAGSMEPLTRLRRLHEEHAGEDGCVDALAAHSIAHLLGPEIDPDRLRGPAQPEFCGHPVPGAPRAPSGIVGGNGYVLWKDDVRRQQHEDEFSPCRPSSFGRWLPDGV